MIFTDDYDYDETVNDNVQCEKDKSQDDKIEELQNTLRQLNNEVLLMQATINGLDNKINDKYAAQTQTLAQNITEAINTLQNELANKTSSALVVADHVQTNTETVTQAINVQGVVTSPSLIVTDRAVIDSENVTESDVKQMNAKVATLQEATIYYLNAVNATINSLSMTNLKTDTFISRFATISDLVAKVVNVNSLKTGLITCNEVWRTPIGEPVNDELLKITVPAYNGIINLISQDGKINVSILNNTLVTYNENEPNLYRVDFSGDDNAFDYSYKEEYTQLKFSPTWGGGGVKYSSTIQLDDDVNPNLITVIYNGTTFKFNPQETIKYDIYKSSNENVYILYYEASNSINIVGWNINPESYLESVEVATVIKRHGEGTCLYFTSSFPYKELFIGEQQQIASYSEIVDRTRVVQNIITEQGTVSATDITFGNNVNVIVRVVNSLPETGNANTIYVVRNDRGYFYDFDNGKYEPLSKYINITYPKVTKGYIDDCFKVHIPNKIILLPLPGYYPAKIEIDGEVFKGTFYKLPSNTKSEWIPQGTQLIYVDEHRRVSFTKSNYVLPELYGTDYLINTQDGEQTELWFDGIDWLDLPRMTPEGDTTSIALEDFEYWLPSVFIGNDESDTDAFVAYDNTVQDFIDKNITTHADRADGISSEALLMCYSLKDGQVYHTEQIEDILTNIQGNTEQIEANATAISNEETRAKAAEEANATAISNEETRAKAAENINAAAIEAINNAKGSANGFASLDSEGHLPVEQLPTSALVYKGQWDASTGAYPTQTSYTIGDFYIVSVEGTVSGIKFYVGDWIIWNGTAWERSANANAVSSVNGKTGAVSLTYSDVSAVPTTRKVNNKALSSNITLSASDVNAVPTTRKVNNKALSSDITLTGGDINVGTEEDSFSVYNAITFGEGNSTFSFTWNGYSDCRPCVIIVGGKHYFAVKFQSSPVSSASYCYNKGGEWITIGESEASFEGYTTDACAHLIMDSLSLYTDKQSKLVSGTNIKTINNKSILGSGNITLADLGISIV